MCVEEVRKKRRIRRRTHKDTDRDEGGEVGTLLSCIENNGSSCSVY